MTPIEQVRQALSGIECHDDSGLLRSKSKDFHWYSPVLSALLQDKTADLLVIPKDVEELRRVASACVRFRVNVTLRGGGTGNYGQ